MAKIHFPVVELDNNKFQVIVDLALYSKDVITATIYKFSHLFYIHQQTDKSNPNLVLVIFESKDDNAITVDIPKKFCNELIDQQLRHDVNAQFGHIRDMIVEEAFKTCKFKIRIWNISYCHSVLNGSMIQNISSQTKSGNISFY